MMFQLLTLVGAVTLFLFGLSLLSVGLQKVAGDGLRSFLASMTSNGFKRLLTGVGVTAAIQSSTATTIMVVSFVNAGLLTLAQAIGVIMGANIGTTVTSWIMAIFGFSYDISTISFPLIALGFIMMMNQKNKKMRDLGEIIIGFALFFVGFAKLKETSGILLDNIDLSGLHALTNLHLGPVNLSVLLFLLIGTVLTICFQSSAATMAIIMLLITTGVIPFKLAAAMILGENIGTTIAANIAASVGNTTSKRAAMAHTVFNVFGVIWVLCIFPWFLKLIGFIIGSCGLPDPNTADLTDVANADTIKASLLYSVTTMHTLFNVTNTLILIWFIPQIEKIVSWIIPQKAEKEVFRLKYIQGGPLSTAELSLDEAEQESCISPRFATMISCTCVRRLPRILLTNSASCVRNLSNMRRLQTVSSMKSRTISIRWRRAKFPNLQPSGSTVCTRLSASWKVSETPAMLWDVFLHAVMSTACLSMKSS